MENTSNNDQNNIQNPSQGQVSGDQNIDDPSNIPVDPELQISLGGSESQDGVPIQYVPPQPPPPNMAQQPQGQVDNKQTTPVQSSVNTPAPQQNVGTPPVKDQTPPSSEINFPDPLSPLHIKDQNVLQQPNSPPQSNLSSQPHTQEPQQTINPNPHIQAQQGPTQTNPNDQTGSIQDSTMTASQAPTETINPAVQHKSSQTPKDTQINPPVATPQAQINTPQVNPQAQINTPQVTPQAQINTPQVNPQAQINTPQVTPQAQINTPQVSTQPPQSPTTSTSQAASLTPQNTQSQTPGGEDPQPSYKIQDPNQNSDGSGEENLDPYLTVKIYPEDLDMRWTSWKCLICEYVYEGVKPINVCPRCGNDDPDKFD